MDAGISSPSIWIPEYEEVIADLFEVCPPSLVGMDIVKKMIIIAKYGELTFDEPAVTKKQKRPSVPAGAVMFCLWVINIDRFENVENEQAIVDHIKKATGALWVRSGSTFGGQGR